MDEPLLYTPLGTPGEAGDEDLEGDDAGPSARAPTMWAVTFGVTLLVHLFAGVAVLIVRYGFHHTAPVLAGCDAVTLLRLLAMVAWGGYAVAVLVRIALLATHALIVALTAYLTRGCVRVGSYGLGGGGEWG
jgi:hypothetical protein